MAEVIGLVASVASLIAFTSETSKACHKLAESTASFKNAQTDIRNISAELLDLAQILELIESVLHPLQDDKIGVQGHVDLVDRSLARIKTSVHEIADILTAVQPTAKGSSTRIRAKWMYKKNGIESMMAVIDKQKQGLLLQFNLLNA